MQSRTFVIDNQGLRSHETAMLVKTACKYTSVIEIEHGIKRVNAKSMMGVLSLGMLSGEEILCTADGDDEKQALDEIESLLKSGFKPA